MDKLEGDYIVQPVVKALQVLDYVARQGHMVSLTDIVHELNLPKTTVFRYLQTLSATGFLEHDVYRDRYGVGCKFRDLAKVDHELKGLRELAQPEMRRLMERFNETVNLAVLADSQIVYIDMLDPLRPMRATARVGHKHPAHSTSLGKAIMAFLPEDQAPQLRESSLSQMTIKTMTDAGKLRRQVEDVRRRGYAVEVGENEDGLMCIGVPILDRAGYPIAAMSLSVPERRMRPELAMVAADALKGAAGRISRQLGGASNEA
jgi:IclR family KDG regulon transcriptional repressor